MTLWQATGNYQVESVGKIFGKSNERTVRYHLAPKLCLWSVDSRRSASALVLKQSFMPFVPKHRLGTRNECNLKIATIGCVPIPYLASPATSVYIEPRFDNNWSGIISLAKHLSRSDRPYWGCHSHTSDSRST
jgi:hypothetical protein